MVTVALSLVQLTAPAITIQSTQGRPGFGSRFVADGDTIVTHEVICRTGRRGESCWQEVRIRSVDGNEVIDRERLYLEPYVHHAFAINHGIVAVREAAWGRTPEQLVLFTGRDGAWRESERLVVEEDCQRLPGDRGDGLHLGDRTLVLGNHVTWCVYEQGTTGWHYSTSIKRTSQLNQDIGVSRDRFVDAGDRVEHFISRIVIASVLLASCAQGPARMSPHGRGHHGRRLVSFART